MAKYHIHKNDLYEILFLSEIYEGPMNLKSGSSAVIKNELGNLIPEKINHVYESIKNDTYIINKNFYTSNEIWPSYDPYKVIQLDNRQKCILIGLDTVDDNLLNDILNTQDIEENIKEKLYSYHDTYYYEIYDKNIDIDSLVKIRDDISVTGLLREYDDTDNVIIEMTETKIHKTYHKYHVYPVAHKVLKYKNHNRDKYNDREIPYQKEKFYTQEEMMKDLFYTPDKSCTYYYVIKNSSDELLFSSEHGKISYPENTTDETLFYVRNDEKIFANEQKGYHLRDIKKGKLGDISKIEEELEELKDAIEQDCKIMTMVELSDLYGAIEAFAETQGLKMEDLEKFSKITKRAFENGYRN